MDGFISLLGATLSRLDLRALIDIAIVTAVLYWLLTLISGTSAATLVRGILILFVVGFLLSNALNLTMLGWLLRNAIPALFVAVPILFASELRRALEQLGRAGTLIPRVPTVSPAARVAETVAAAAQQLSDRRWGALIVLERETGIGEYLGTGTMIDGLVSAELLLNIFFPNSPLHDGAVVMRGDRVLAAGVVLPLAESGTFEHMGTRHRAAIGISERSDAVVVVVSEETGTISLANRGRMVRNLSEGHLRRVLSILERAPGGESRRSWRNLWGLRRTREARGTAGSTERTAEPGERGSLAKAEG